MPGIAAKWSMSATLFWLFGGCVGVFIFLKAYVMLRMSFPTYSYVVDVGSLATRGGVVINDLSYFCLRFGCFGLRWGTPNFSL